MLSRWDLWKFSEESNCWDFVRAFLEGKIPPEHIPQFGVCSKDALAKTKCRKKIVEYFAISEPVQYAIACHFQGKALVHVGVVDGGKVRHSSPAGTRCDNIEKFESMAQRTEYRLHKCLL